MEGDLDGVAEEEDGGGQGEEIDPQSAAGEESFFHFQANDGQKLQPPGGEDLDSSAALVELRGCRGWVVVICRLLRRR